MAINFIRIEDNEGKGYIENDGDLLRAIRKKYGVNFK
jgi:hypothetical protein